MEAPPVFFGGVTRDAIAWDVIFCCPIEGKSFTESIRLAVADHEEIESVEMQNLESSEVQLEKNETDAKDQGNWLDKELADRIKGSFQSAQDFCKTMISTSTGAIAVYFAISKFLGVEVSGTGWHMIRVIPPLLFLLSTVLLIVAIRPSLISLNSAAQYGAVREARLRRFGTFMDIASWLFLAGITVAFIVWLFKV